MSTIDLQGARRTEQRRFAGFVVTGGIAAGVNLGARWALSHALPYPAAIAIAYLLGMATAYCLSRAYVFERTGQRWTAEFARFALVNAASFLVVLGVSLMLARWLLPAIGWRWHAEDVAHLVGVASPIVLSYYAHKHFSFGARA